MKKLIVMLILLCLLPCAAMAAENPFTVNGGAYTWDETNQVLTITAGPAEITGPKEDGYFINVNNACIWVKDGVDVTLNQLNITNTSSEHPAVFIEGTSTVTSKGTSTLTGGTGRAGIEVNANGHLILEGDGLLQTLGKNAAGIGAGNMAGIRSVTINSGKVSGRGGDHAAGIGGSPAGDASVTINGGTVVANGGSYGAGIGGAKGQDGNVTITGGTVEATGGHSAAGIGGGFYGNGEVLINGGKILLAEGDKEPYTDEQNNSYFHAGVGGVVYNGVGNSSVKIINQVAEISQDNASWTALNNGSVFTSQTDITGDTEAFPFFRTLWTASVLLPSTGDSAMLGVWIFMLLTSVTGMVLCWKNKKLCSRK